MKYSFIFYIFSCFPATSFGQEVFFNSKTRIYLVRHAEKDTGNNPGLTVAGKKRAGDLARLLKYENIRRIYTTAYRRTEMTADSMRIQLLIDTVQYLADTTGTDLVQRITSNHDLGNTILIIGHANTIPKIIRRLGVMNHSIQNIPDSMYDNLFLVTFQKHKAVLSTKNYGSRSGPPAGIKAMQELK